MAEHLDHLLAGHHLLDVAVHRAQILLLLGKVHGGAPGDFRADKEHDAQHGDGQQRQGHVQHKQAHQGDDHGHQGVYHLG